MNELVELRDVSYAVIEGLRVETGHEHIIIAYPNEKSLRDAFAASSILAFGFSTRDEALSAGRTSLPNGVTGQQTAKTIAVGKIGRPARTLNAAEPRGESSSIFMRLKEFAASFRDAVTAAIVFFSSSNSISAAIRMALGSSV